MKVPSRKRGAPTHVNTKYTSSAHNSLLFFGLVYTVYTLGVFFGAFNTIALLIKKSTHTKQNESDQ